MKKENLGNAIEALIPKTLGDIVRRNHELCTIRLSTPKEIDSLEAQIVSDNARAKDKITEWRLVCLDRLEKAGGPIHVLVGFAEWRGGAWSTSPVTAIDRSRGLATTQSGSIYQLEGLQAAGEPDGPGLVRLAYMLSYWGWGGLLGIPIF